MNEALIKVTCYRCKTVFGLPESHYRAAKASEKVSFYCSYGHGQIFSEGPSEADLLRRERDRLAQKVAQVEDEKRIAWNTANEREEMRAAAERRASAARGQVTRLKNRAAAGLCPCCNRSFVNLQRHMSTQHKGFAADGATFNAARDAAHSEMGR
jgi:hypothetical protein